MQSRCLVRGLKAGFWHTAMIQKRQTGKLGQNEGEGMMKTDEGRKRGESRENNVTGC